MEYGLRFAVSLKNVGDLVQGKAIEVKPAFGRDQI